MLIEKCINKLKLSPIFINIETTNACNADCIMCPHTIMKREIGIMNDKIFIGIIESAIESGIEIKEFILSGFGVKTTMIYAHLASHHKRVAMMELEQHLERQEEKNSDSFRTVVQKEHFVS